MPWTCLRDGMHLFAALVAGSPAMCPLCGAVHSLCPNCQAWWEGQPPCRCGWSGSVGASLILTSRHGTQTFGRGEAVRLFGPSLRRQGLIAADWEVAVDLGLLVFDHSRKRWAVCLSPKLPPGQWVTANGIPIDPRGGSQPVDVPGRLHVLHADFTLDWK